MMRWAQALLILTALAFLTACGIGGEPSEGVEPGVESADASPEPEAGRASQSWPTYHGEASLDGVAEGVRLPDALKPAWRFMAGAPVFMTPVSDGVHVFFANAEGNVFAVDQGGEEVWSRTIPREAAEEKPARFDAPLACFRDTLFAGSMHGVLYALDAGTGEVRWQRDLDGTILGTANAWFPPGAGTDGRVFAIEQAEGVLHAFRIADGEPLWQSAPTNRCDGSPGVGRDAVVFGSCASALHIFSPETGALLREAKLGDESQVAGGVAVVDAMAFSGSRSGSIVSIALEAGESVWTNTDCDDEIFTTPAVNREWVVAGASDGRIYALDRADGSLRWKRELGREAGSPVIAGDKVLVTADGRLFLLRLADGNELWSHEVSDEVSAPAVAGGLVVTGCGDGTVAAFRWGGEGAQK